MSGVHLATVSVIDSLPVGLRIWDIYDDITQEGEVAILEWDKTQFRWLKSVHLGPFPSFDCRNGFSENEKTLTPTDKMICDNETLSHMDFALSSNYNAIKSVGNEQENGRLQSAQSAWMKQRDTCKTTECLLDSYTKRITELCTNYPPISDRVPACISAIEAKTFFREITR
jgi:uncharacterized protein